LADKEFYRTSHVPAYRQSATPNMDLPVLSKSHHLATSPRKDEQEKYINTSWLTPANVERWLLLRTWLSTSARTFQSISPSQTHTPTNL